MQYRYSEKDFPIAVKHLTHNPKILTLFSDEDAVEEYSLTGKIDDNYYTRHIKVDDLAARQRIVCGLYYARHSDIPRGIAEIIISAMNSLGWKLELELSKEERDNNPLPKYQILRDAGVITGVICFLIFVIFLVLAKPKSLLPERATQTSLLIVEGFVVGFIYFCLHSTLLKQYNYGKELRKAKRDEKRLTILQLNNQSPENQALKTMLENTQSPKYYIPNVNNFQVNENVYGSVVNYNYATEQIQNLAEDANEFLQQLEQLSPAYPSTLR